MLVVKFADSIVISEDKLGALLALAGVPAVVTPFMTGVSTTVDTAPVAAPKRRGRKPKAEAVPTAPAAPGKKRGRKSNAEKAALAATAEAAAAGAMPADVSSGTAEAEPVAESAAAETPPADPPASETASAAEAAPVDPKPGKKSGGKKNGSEAKKPEAVADGAAPANADELLQRFTVLIDKDFAGAKAVLDGFGVSRFSDIKADQYPGFAEKLSGMGV